MSQGKIYLIIGLIVAALVGVIILQLRLIQTGLEVNERRYDASVQESLRAAAHLVEEEERAHLRFRTNGFNQPGGLNRTPIGGELSGSITRSGTSLLGGTPYHITERTTFAYRAQLAARALEDRLEADQLDQKLREEFRNAGLEEPLQYGVYDSREQEFILRNGRKLSAAGADTARHRDLWRSPYRVSLFAEDEGGPAGYLLAYSPQRERVVYSSVSGNLLASLLFVSIIIGCFAYTIYVILRQKQVSEMKTDFINNMTHEFKTPIATISLATDSITSPRIAGNPDKVRRFANIIKQENKRMNDQVEKVLQMAKLDKNKLNLNLTAVDMHGIIRDAAEYISLQVEPRGGRVTTRLMATPSVVEGDRTHLSSLVNNLLDNANKYSAEAPRITVSTRHTPKGFEFTVADRGIGMSREARKNIFDRFYRVHTGDRHDVKGFGLGLSYVKTITEVHGGSIQVKSELGVGSSFTILLPYHQT